MNDQSDHPFDAPKRHCLACTLYGVGVGAGTGFCVAFAGTLVLLANSGEAVAGGGEGAALLTALCFCSGGLGSLLGAGLGGWSGYKMSEQV